MAVFSVLSVLSVPSVPSVPKSMTRQRDEVQGLPLKYIITAVSFLILSVILIIVAAYSNFYGQVVCLILRIGNEV